MGLRKGAPSCFGPPLSDEKLARYRELIATVESRELRDCLDMLLPPVERWWNDLDYSKETGRTIVYNQGTPRELSVDLVPLPQAQVDVLDDVLPWMWQLDAMEPVLSRIPAGELRDCAYHLLWFCKELTLDQEPVTQDMVGLAPTP